MNSLVIQQGLQGERRDKIAGDNGLSAGAVTNIVNEWKNGLGFALADALRELALTLKRIGISPAQCADGFRVAMMMNKLGVRNDNYESFMTEIYTRCNNIGLSPEKIASHISDLLEFSRTLPFSQIPDYIDQRIREKEKIEQNLESLEDQMADLEAQRSVAEELRDMALKDQKMTDAKLKWYSDIREELRKYEIPVDDISHLAKIANGIKQFGYDPEKVLYEFSNLEFLKTQCQGYQGSIARLKDQCDTLSRDRSLLEQLVTSHNQSLAIYGELEAMGFGLKELKLLWHTVREISSANNIPSNEAVLRFLEDIDEHYDNRLGFETKVHKLQSQINKLTQEEARLRVQILGLPLVNPSLIRLVQKGVSEQDIIDFSELLKADGPGSKDSSKSSSSGITLEEIRTFVGELRIYGNIKTTLNQFGQKVDELKNQITSLRAEKQELDAENQRLFSTIQCSKQLMSFFSGSSLVLRSEITALASIMASITYVLVNQLEELRKLQDGSSHPSGDEFVPLAMAVRGEAVDLPKLKLAVIKSIEIMLEKLKGGDKMMTTEILSNARLALVNEQF